MTAMTNQKEAKEKNRRYAEKRSQSDYSKAGFLLLFFFLAFFLDSPELLYVGCDAG